MTTITWTDRSFSLAGARRGARRTIPIGVTVVVYGTVFGALAAQAGLSPLEAVLMSGLVFAGGAQFIVLELWDTPLPIVALVLTTLVVNLRLLLMGATLSGWLNGLRPARKALLASFISDESWALTTRAREDGESDRAFLIGSGVILFVSWVAATALGASTGSLIDDPAALGLDFTFTAVFLTLLAGFWRGHAVLAPWLLAAAVALVVEQLVDGPWYILAGGLAGSGFGAWRGDRQS
jgi:4-azaleucine resistance transporter AzlC